MRWKQKTTTALHRIYLYVLSVVRTIGLIILAVLLVLLSLPMLLLRVTHLLLENAADPER
jgi:hypothetical protein